MICLSSRTNNISKSKLPRKRTNDDNGGLHPPEFSTNFKRPKYVAPPTSKYGDQILGFLETGYMKVTSERPAVLMNPSRTLGQKNSIEPKKGKYLEEWCSKVARTNLVNNLSKRRLLASDYSLPTSRAHVASDWAPSDGREKVNRLYPAKSDVKLNCKPGPVEQTGKYFFLANLNRFQDQVDVSRNNVVAILGLFAKVYEDEMEAKLRGQGKAGEQISYTATSIVKQEIKWIHRDGLGAIRGIEIGDQFQFKGQLVLVGLHYQYNSGISYIREGQMSLATSIVDSNRYSIKTADNDPERILFSGQGGNPLVSRTTIVEDQKLKRGNLALKNSMDAVTPVRVIRKIQISVASKKVLVFVYDGLYIVTKCTRERGPLGKLIFMFELKRMPGQPNLVDCRMH